MAILKINYEACDKFKEEIENYMFNIKKIYDDRLVKILDYERSFNDDESRELLKEYKFITELLIKEVEDLYKDIERIKDALYFLK